jgi:hypothetical protein
MTDISDELRDLILRYMTACNEGRYAESEELLAQIKKQGLPDDEETT